MAAKKGKYEKWLTGKALLLLTGWARDGLSYEEIAHNMGVSRNTLTVWREKYPQIDAALDEGREVADKVVENALFMRAQGRTVTLKRPIKTKIVEYQDGKKCREYEKIVYADYEDYVPGDTAAQIFFLKNRLPKVWRDKQEAAVSADIEDLSPLLELLK